MSHEIELNFTPREVRRRDRALTAFEKAVDHLGAIAVGLHRIAAALEAADEEVTAATLNPDTD